MMTKVDQKAINGEAIVARLTIPLCLVQEFQKISHRTIPQKYQNVDSAFSDTRLILELQNVEKTNYWMKLSWKGEYQRYFHDTLAPHFQKSHCNKLGLDKIIQKHA
ncbi:hypothetical protein RB195_026205 [Necator americanus]|uniref:Uncharacterized protein n=1 Tax=Necator americanus TaxID=51031 RepID=A0ABR1EVW3_NECAM